jgi:class 3 adenylate cyclase
MLYNQLISEYSEKGLINETKLVEESLESFRSEQNERISYTKYKKEGGLINFIGWKIIQVKSYYRNHKTLSFLVIISFSIVLIWTGIFIIRKKHPSKRTTGKRLAALVFSDIVGYTELMGKDEKMALGVLDSNRSIHVQEIGRYNGQFLKEMGDGMLCSFSTASDSVKFCIDVQRGIRSLDKYKLRMGVHLGEVVFSKGDVFGDGVNIASRLQGEANEGGICISDTVYQNIKNQTDIDVSFLGERELKHVTTKIRMYEVKY